jgi:hypothetical protein
VVSSRVTSIILYNLNNPSLGTQVLKRELIPSVAKTEDPSLKAEAKELLRTLCCEYRG